MTVRMTVRSAFFLILSVNSLAVLAAFLTNHYTGINIYDEIGKGGFITILSFLQLLAISLLSLKTYNLRKGFETDSVNNGYNVWAIIALGFLFLAFDDLIRIHENIDDMFHSLLQIQETGLTDRIDDVIIIIYGLIGLGVLAYYRSELRKYSRTLPAFILGFLLFFSMAALDVLTNSFDILALLFDQDIILDIYLALSFAEDSFKLFAEGTFLLAFYMIWYQTNLTVKQG